jgi:putative endopeptidase
LARHPVPATLSIWGSFEEVAARSDSVLRHLLEAAAARESTASQDGSLQKLGDLYGSCMDTVRINAAGAKPLLPELRRLARVRDVGTLTTAIARLHLQGVNVLFRFRAVPDFKQSSRIIGSLSQGGLGLPNRDHYTSNASAGHGLRDAYLEHIARMFELLGSDSATAHRDADRAMAIETDLASASMGVGERRDPNTIYHLTTLAELQRLAPAFQWDRYFIQLNLPDLHELNVAQPQFVRAVDRLVRTVPPATWSAYLRWRLLDRLAPALSEPFATEDFRFRRTLTGTSTPPPRSSRCLRATEAAMGHALGGAYVAQAFSPGARAVATDLVLKLQAVLRERLLSLDWMSEATRTQALAKLDALGRKVGYPDRPRDYSALAVTRESYVQNVVRASEFATRHEVAKIDRPLDHGDWWHVTPQFPDAFYSRVTNEVVLPAGILQPPFFDAESDDASNYGAIGAFIGHELTHAFDDAGRQFDAQGNLRDWWTREDAERFKGRAKLLVEQFNGYTAVDTIRVNGNLTVGENISDLGGLRIAYEAVQRAVRAKSRGVIDGFTPEQRFFLAFARIWRANIRPEWARDRALVDPHAPRRWRVNGPLSNMQEFARAFGCNPGDPMVRPDSLQAAIW